MPLLNSRHEFIIIRTNFIYRVPSNEYFDDTTGGGVGAVRSLFPMGSSNLRPVQSSPVFWNFPLPDLHPTSPVGVVSNYVMACLGGQPV